MDLLQSITTHYPQEWKSQTRHLIYHVSWHSPTVQHKVTLMTTFYAQASLYSRVDGVGGWWKSPTIWSWKRKTIRRLSASPFLKGIEVYRIWLGSLLDWWALTMSSDKMEPPAVLHDNRWSSRRTTAPHTSRSSSFTPAPLLQRLSNTQRPVSQELVGQYPRAEYSTAETRHI